MNSLLKNLIYLLIALAILAAVLIPRLWPSKAESSKGPAASNSKADGKTAEKVRVKVEKVSVGTLNNSLQLIGSLIPEEQVQLMPEVSGKIDKIYFQEGQRVKKGQLLVSLVADDLKAQLKKLQYSASLAQLTENRQKQLLAREAISKQEYDIAQNALNTTQADIANLKAQIAKYQITAPFSGTMGLRYISEGAFVNTTTKIADLVNAETIKAEFSIPGKYVNALKVGQEISFTVEGNNTQTYTAKIYAINAAIDNATRTLTVRARYPNADGKLKVGSFISIKLALKNAEQTLMIPSEAITADATGPKVFLVRNGILLSKPIEAGIRTSSKVQVLNGLKTGDSLVVSGVQMAKDGAIATIVN